jgi:chitin-binding protein
MDYLIYRDGVEVRSVGANQTTYDDSGLTPDTAYRYSVRARDLNGRLSAQSNVLSVSTQGEGGAKPAWKLDTLYEVGAEVRHSERKWSCKQRHTSYTTDWAPGVGDNVLWAELTK